MLCYTLLSKLFADCPQGKSYTVREPQQGALGPAARVIWFMEEYLNTKADMAFIATGRPPVSAHVVSVSIWVPGT